MAKMKNKTKIEAAHELSVAIATAMGSLSNSEVIIIVEATFKKNEKNRMRNDRNTTSRTEG